MTSPAPSGTWMLYGAYGYTGRLLLDVALARGHRPILAGRDPARLAELGAKTGLPVRAFALDDVAAAAKSLTDVEAVLHAAGPFSKTARPMLEALLLAGATNRAPAYLDITGEIEVFEMVQAMGPSLAARRLVAIPGVGFDVVPSDCLAALAKERLPEATKLRLVFRNRGGGLSPGTAKTMLETKGGRVRRGGKIEVVPAAYAVRTFSFPSGEGTAVTIPWGDVSTAFHSTGIPNIETYIGLPRSAISTMQRSAKLQWLTSAPIVRPALQALIGRFVKGPDAESRAKAGSEFVAEVESDRGDVVRLGLRTPEGYSLTAETAVRAVEHVLANELPGGAYTPSKAFGARFIFEAPGTELVE